MLIAPPILYPNWRMDRQLSSFILSYRGCVRVYLKWNNIVDVLITKSLTFAKVFRIGQRKKGKPLTLELCTCVAVTGWVCLSKPSGRIFFLAKHAFLDATAWNWNKTFFLSLIFMRKAFTAMAPTQNLLVKRLSERATVPTRGSSHAAGYDLYR